MSAWQEILDTLKSLVAKVESFNTVEDASVTTTDVTDAAVQTPTEETPAGDNPTVGTLGETTDATPSVTVDVTTPVETPEVPVA